MSSFDIEEHGDGVLKAHNNLNAALTSLLHKPSFQRLQHVATFPPADRPNATVALQTQISQISHIMSRLEEWKTLQKELEHIYHQFNVVKGSLLSCLSPVGSMPHEIIQQVAEFAVDSPRHTRQILTLSHVCRKWRQAVFDISNLFTSPDWLHWPSTTRHDWLARAGERTLEARLAAYEPGKEISLPVEAVFEAITPFMNRLRTLGLQLGPRGDSTSQEALAFELMFRSPMPCVEAINISGAYDWSAGFDPILMPRLRSLHCSELQLTCAPSGSVTWFQSLGWRVHTQSDLGRLFDVLELQQNAFHLTLYAHPRHGFDNPLTLYPPRDPPFAHLTSLRLHGFCGLDEQWFNTLIVQFRAPQLRSLELFEMSWEVFDILVTDMPKVASSNVRSLLIAGFDQISLRRFFSALSPQIPDSDAGRDLPFPNLEQLIFQDLQYTDPALAEAAVDALIPCVAPRKGVLKSLVLPATLAPKLSDISDASAGLVDENKGKAKQTKENDGSGEDGGDDESEEAEPPDVKSLTLEEELSLQEASGLSKIEYLYILDHHGYDLPQPFYFSP
ncbi:hypothetical protein DL93DRAFT_2171905 [Clavulina sp. PMI_390]|nr:hypothetical protein DL93DRAFT_2171905 [Clavulina sp. PMI_390]